MDSKISDFPVATGTSVADLIPIISGGLNKTVTVGIFSLNLPNLGNKGISKNIVTPVSSGTVIPLTNTIKAKPNFYNLHFHDTTIHTLHQFLSLKVT
jgi:hypothetical protein